MNLTTGQETVFRGKPDELLSQIGSVAMDASITVVIEGYRMGKPGNNLSP